MEIRQKIISALMYPSFTLLATIATLAAMLLFIVPVFKDIYKDLNATLPAPTLLLISVSDFLVSYAWIVILVLSALLVALRRYYLTPEGRLAIDAIKLKIPLLGVLFRKSASANLTGSLAGLLDSGLPLIEALQTSSRVCGNEVMAQAIRSVALHVTQGRRLSDEMERTEQFPLMVVRMMAIAEDIGTLPDVLKEIAASYIEEVEYTIRRILMLVEPCMVLFVAGIVGCVLVALYYPIFNLGNVFLKGA
jgi:type IV pilus assembly protein PilC